MEIERNQHSGSDKTGTAATMYRNGNGAHQAHLNKLDVCAGGIAITGNYSNFERRNTVKYAKKTEKLGDKSYTAIQTTCYELSTGYS